MLANKFIDSIDDSHQMTTNKEHIQQICDVIKDTNGTIVELGSHAGISAAAIALSAPESKVFSIDLCDTINEKTRINYWNSLGINNIIPKACSAIDFLRSSGIEYDYIFHDAMHGSRAMNEYLLCAGLARRGLFIHDFEQLTTSEQNLIMSMFDNSRITFDTKGRALFIGLKQC